MWREFEVKLIPTFLQTRNWYKKKHKFRESSIRFLGCKIYALINAMAFLLFPCDTQIKT